MGHDFSEEFLSAYFDGELSPEERARMEEHLNANPESRRQLEQMERLSGLLRELKKEPAPPEFRAAVMQNIERQMLLGPPPSLPAPAGSSARRRNSWVYGGSAFAVAALLLVAVAYYAGNPAGMNQPEGDAIALNDRGAMPGETSRPVTAPMFGRDAEGKTASNERFFRSDRTLGEAEGAAPAASAPAAPAEVATRELSARPMAHSRAVSRGRPSQLVFGKEQLRDAEIGDVVKALEHADGEVSVVFLTVVDRVKGLEGFQSLLTRNAIVSQPNSATEADQEESERFDYSTSSKVGLAGDLECVFVEAPSEKLAAVLQELKEEMEFRELRVDVPVALVALDSRSGNRLLGDPSHNIARQPREESSIEPQKERVAADKKSDGEAEAKEAASPDDAPAKAEALSPQFADIDADSKNIPKRSSARGGQMSQLFAEPRQVQMTLTRDDFFDSQTVSKDAEKMTDALEKQESRLSGLRAKRAQQGVRAPVVASRPDVARESLAAKPLHAEQQAGETSGKKVAEGQKNAPVQVLFVLIDQKTGLPIAPPITAPSSAPKKARGDAPRERHDDGAAS